MFSIHFFGIIFFSPLIQYIYIMSGNNVFSAEFIVQEVDKDGKDFDDVSRLLAITSDNSTELLLDYNCKLFYVRERDKLSFSITPTLGTQSSSNETHWHPSQVNTSSSYNNYSYIMFGQRYHYDESEFNRPKVYYSFGGLLMRLTGDKNKIESVQKNKEVYLLMRNLTSEK